ncbi:MAG: glycosyl transferase family 1 [Fimbriimonadales bacterium]|nr:MAG: glycosyl transferase family 1 [Fimbriimonadales bacterium]
MSCSPLPLVCLDATLAGGENTGDSTYWTGLIRGLFQCEPRVRIALLTNRQPPKELSDPPEWAHWEVLKGKGRYFNQVGMPLFARRRRACAFHTQYTLSPLAPGGITTVHDVSFLIGPEWFRPKDRFLLSRTVPGSVRRARKVITVSETSKNDIVRLLGVPPEKVVVTYNGVDARFRPVGEGEVSACRAKYGIEGSYCLTVGTLWPRKNMTLAVEAMKLLPENVPHRLVIVGKAGWEAVADHPRVLRTGYVPDEDMPALYCGADLYLCPSRYEGFGLPVVEAMACGTPVVSSSGGALPEVVGDAGVVIPSWEPEEWARVIQELLGNWSMLAQMREAGLERSKRFTWRKAAERTLRVYEEVCGVD